MYIYNCTEKYLGSVGYESPGTVQLPAKYLGSVGYESPGRVQLPPKYLGSVGYESPGTVQLPAKYLAMSLQERYNCTENTLEVSATRFSQFLQSQRVKRHTHAHNSEFCTCALQ